MCQPVVAALALKHSTKELPIHYLDLLLCLHQRIYCLVELNIYCVPLYVYCPFPTVSSISFTYRSSMSKKKRTRESSMGEEKLNGDNNLFLPEDHKEKALHFCSPVELIILDDFLVITTRPLNGCGKIKEKANIIQEYLKNYCSNAVMNPSHIPTSPLKLK